MTVEKRAPGPGEFSEEIGILKGETLAEFTALAILPQLRSTLARLFHAAFYDVLRDLAPR